MMKRKILIVLIILVIGFASFFAWKGPVVGNCPYECCLKEKLCSSNRFCENHSCKELKLVSVQGTNFVLGDEPFHFIGAFTFPVLTHQIYEEWRTDWKEKIDEYLNSLELLDVRVIRLFAFGPYEIKTCGRSEPNWERLDYLMEQCEKRGIYVVFVLWDYWDYSSDGTISGELYRFWEDKRIKSAITKMVNRYKNSNAVFAWEVINEGDLKTMKDHYPELYSWTKEMADYIKSLDQRHLISTGFSQETLRETYFEIPDSYQEVRDRIIKINKIPAVDFITFHSYGGPIDIMTDPGWYGTGWENRMRWFVNEATAIRSEVKKPLLFEEWGVQRQVGEPTKEKVYSFLLTLFVENEVDNIFNGWGDEKELQSMLIYTEDVGEIELILKAMHEFST